MAMNDAFPHANSELRAGVYDVAELDEFGASGDVFDHRFWRGVFAALWSIESTHRKFHGMFTDLFMRGKSLKNLNKGTARSATFDIPKEVSPGAKRILGDGGKYRITVNYATQESRIQSKELTPERLKCLARSVYSSTFVTTGRFPATTSSIGYATLVVSLRDYCEAMRRDTASPLRETYKADIDIWNPIAATVAGSNLEMYLQPLSASAGCFSSKEIYQEDEDQFPGCIFWSGIHALMTDASNKIRSKDAPQDVRARLEASNFYGDFKRKMASRGIVSVVSEEYYKWLEVMQDVMIMFLRSTSGIGARESNVLDTLINQAMKASLKAEKQPTALRTEEDALKELEYIKPDKSPLLITDFTKGEMQTVKYLSKLYHLEEELDSSSS